MYDRPLGEVMPAAAVPMLNAGASIALTPAATCPHGLDGNKWPFKQIDVKDFQKVIRFILDPNNRPLLVHCNKGKHRTGCVVACLRKVRGWSLSSIFAEYLMFSDPKSRLEDQRFIESFELDDDDLVVAEETKDENEGEVTKEDVL